MILSAPTAPLNHSAEEAVPLEVVEPVRVQLAGYELMKERSAPSREDVDAKVEPPTHLTVEPLHNEVGHDLVVNIDHKVLERVREGAVADIVQEYCRESRPLLPL